MAAAVEGLSPQQVAVLDSDGSLLGGTASGTAADGDLDARAETEASVEGRIRARIDDLLRPILLERDFHVSVDVALNFDTVRQVNDRLLAEGSDGNGLITHKHVSSSGSGEVSERSQNDEESDFAHGSMHEEIARAPGRIERLSVAVVLPRDLDDFEVERIQTLIAAAAGIDTTRGDRLEVSRLARTDTSAASLSAPPITAMRPIAIGTPQATAWSHWVLIVVASMLLGLIVAFGLQRRPRTLLPQEREAVLAKLRNWLSEGGALS